MIRKFELKTRIIFLTRENYIQLSYGNNMIYGLEIYKEELNNLLKIVDNLNFIEKAFESIHKGIFIVKKNDKIFAYNTFLGTELCWFHDGENIVISDSEIEIAREYSLEFDNNQLAKYLILGLPIHLLQSYSMWKKIYKTDIFKYIILDSRNSISIQSYVSTLKIGIKDENYSLESIKKYFFDYISNIVNKYNNISADLSGGIDSACIAYMLNKINHDFLLFHAESSVESNSDTKWAEGISEDIHCPLIKLTSLEKINHRFEMDHSYIGNKVPSNPLLWADTEHYLEEVIENTKNQQSHVHFIGIGGDELFTSMPATPWSILRQEKLKSINYVLKYCLIVKRNSIDCLRDFIDNKSLTDELRQKYKEAFRCSKKNIENRNFSWIDKIIIPDFLSTNYRNSIKERLDSELLDKEVEFHKNRAKYQAISSLIFQKKVLEQVNRQLAGILDVEAPFLNYQIVKTSMNIPDKIIVGRAISKEILYQTLKGIVPVDIFTRRVKGDYSSPLYSSYRKFVKENSDHIWNTELVRREIVDGEKLTSILSLPTANPIIIEFFEKFCILERWIRQVDRYMEGRNNENIFKKT